MNEEQAQLIAEQLSHAIDLLRNQVSEQEKALAHHEALYRQRIEALERSQEDQEIRLRQVTDGIVRLNTSTGLAQVAQAGLSVLLAALAAWMGARN
ncbi:MAG: hypothetical protein ABFD44_07910 [Anaerolineaceae bacterium]